jgi:hypothetical protein
MSYIIVRTLQVLIKTKLRESVTASLKVEHIIGASISLQEMNIRQKTNEKQQIFLPKSGVNLTKTGHYPPFLLLL